MLLHLAGDAFDNGVELLLREKRQLLLRILRILGEDAGVLHGKQVVIGDHIVPSVFLQSRSCQIREEGSRWHSGASS